MTSQADKAERFLELHHGPGPLLIPNPWDAGTARLLEWLGFSALATTSSGFAATLGRLDGSVTREEALEHAAAISAAVTVPVSADLENAFSDSPEGVAETMRLATATGLAGCSVEDATGRDDDPIYDQALAVDRVAAAAEAATDGPGRLVLTARAENYLYGRRIWRTRSRACRPTRKRAPTSCTHPGLTSLSDIREVVRSVDRPVNVLALGNGPSVAELAEAGVSRISVGGAFAYAALGALVEAATELRDQGTYGYLARTKVGRSAVQAAFTG